MALTASTMLPLGTLAPEFHLPDVVSGNTISLSTFTGKQALLVMFICQHCPFVVSLRLVRFRHCRVCCCAHSNRLGRRHRAICLP